MDPFLCRYKDLCDKLMGLWKAGEGDKAMELLFKVRSDPGLCLSDRVSVNLLLADMGDVQRMDCEKLADDALYVCEAMRRLRDTLLGNTSIPELDITVFENLEMCAHISLNEIAQREKLANMQGKLLHKEEFTEEQRMKRRDDLRGPNTVDMLTMLKIVNKSGDGVSKSPPQPAPGSPGTSTQVGGSTHAREKMPYPDAKEHQNASEPAKAFHSRIRGEEVTLIGPMEQLLLDSTPNPEDAVLEATGLKHS